MVDKPKAKVGDWIRFYEAGKLVIGVIEYITIGSILNDVTYNTNIGNVDEEYVLEIRTKLHAR